MPTYTVIRDGKEREVTVPEGKRTTITGGGSVIDRVKRNKDSKGKTVISGKNDSQILFEAGKKDSERLEKERLEEINNRSYEEKKASFLQEVQRVKEQDFVTKRAKERALNRLENRKDFKKRIIYPSVSEVKQGEGIQARTVEYEEIIKPTKTPSGMISSSKNLPVQAKLESKIQAKEVEALRLNIQGSAFKEFGVNTEIFFLQGAKDVVGLYDFVSKPSLSSGGKALENLGAGIDNPRLSPARFTTSLGIQLGLEVLGGGLSAEKISSDLAKVIKISDSLYIPKTGAFKVEVGGKFVQLTSKNLGKAIVEETGYITYLDKGQKTSQLLKVESRFIGELGKGAKTQFTTGKGVAQLTDIEGNVLKQFTFTTKSQFQNKLGKIGLKSGSIGESRTSLYEILPSKSIVLGESKKFEGFVQKLRATSYENIVSKFKIAEKESPIVKAGKIEPPINIEIGGKKLNLGYKNIERSFDKNFRSVSSDIYDFDTKIFKQSQQAEEVLKMKIKDTVNVKDFGLKGDFELSFEKGGDLTQGVFKNQEIFNTKQLNNVLKEQNALNVKGLKNGGQKFKDAFSLNKKAQVNIGKLPKVVNTGSKNTKNVIKTSGEVGELITEKTSKLINQGGKSSLINQPSISGLVSESLTKGSLKSPQGLGVGIFAKEQEKTEFLKIPTLGNNDLLTVNELNKEFKIPLKSQTEKISSPEIDYLSKLNTGIRLKQNNVLKKSQSKEIAQVIKQTNNKLKVTPIINSIPRSFPRTPKKPPITPPIILPSININSSGKKSGGNFGALVKIGGKYKIVGQQNVSLRKAIRIGSRYVQRTSSASFKIVDLSSGNYAKLSSIELPRAFSKGKGDKESFVEKNKFRIDTGGEFQGITLKGIRASSKKVKGVLGL